jgi:rare lipoprotein A (peptidoglycan hydrolase)
MLLVTNTQNGKSDTVEVTDRHNAGINHIDLSKTSFSKIANLKQGRIKVSIQKIN